MGREMSITEFVKRFQAGEFEAPDVHTQIKAGWYDWFCKSTSLVAKTKSLGKKVVKLSKSPKINCNESYVFFKNNCPCVGNLYDSFSICDIKTGDVQFWITPKSGHTGEAEVSGPENGFTAPLVKGAWSDVVAWFFN